MSFSKHNVINFLAMQVCWMVTCYGSGQGYPWAGPVISLFWLAMHIHFVRERAIETRIIMLAAIYGFIADSVLVLSGVIYFPVYAQLGAPATIWMVVLWMNFAATLRHSLSWLQGCYWIAVLCGASAGPLAYYAGSKLGAISIAPGWYAYLSIAMVWIIAMPLFLWFVRRTQSQPLHEPIIIADSTRGCS